MTEVLFTEELNPTFLFAWNGIRSRDEKDYHFHDNQIEMSIIMDGQGQYRIDGEVYNIKAGDILIINPGVYHQALTIEGATFFESFIGFTDVAFKGMPANHFVLEGTPLIHTSGALQQKIFRLAKTIKQENEQLQPGRYFMMRSCLIQILLLLIRAQSKAATPKKGYAFESVSKLYIVEQIASYFEEHYAEKISLDQIADNMYLSPFYISKVFKSETGSTPIHYLIDIRLEHAKELLEKGDCNSIQEVAQRVGYDDAYHFSKLFKKKYGLPPSKI